MVQESERVAPIAVSALRKNYYQDSLRLMQISRALYAVAGVKKAAAMMASETNLKLLKAEGLLNRTFESVSANDLVIAVQADSEQTAQQAIARADELLAASRTENRRQVGYKSLEAALDALPQANMAIISVPGPYAKLEAAKAIERGLHIFLFSDNVPLDEEIELKERAAQRGLLVMGPGCGTALLNGRGLGFANRVRRGPVGMVSAAGTGMQEVASLIHNLGSGISHAIGVGGRDLSEEVGGIMTLQSIRWLARDDDTEVMVLVSKPPCAEVARKIVHTLEESPKPAVLCLLGSELKASLGSRVRTAWTLEQAAWEALGSLRQRRAPDSDRFPHASLSRKAARCIESLSPSQRYVRGLFSGGTLCYEAQAVLRRYVAKVHSNAPLRPQDALKDVNRSKGHTCVDLGEEEFTRGRPHPMIDASQRCERLLREARDRATAVILFDVVLGYVAGRDPAGDLLPAIQEARRSAREKGRALAFVAHVCGTQDDPQDLKTQCGQLARAGVIVLPTNARAARLAAWIATRGKRGESSDEFLTQVSA